MSRALAAFAIVVTIDLAGGETKDTVPTVLELVASLHPTPAVNGDVSMIQRTAGTLGSHGGEISALTEQTPGPEVDELGDVHRPVHVGDVAEDWCEKLVHGHFTVETHDEIPDVGPAVKVRAHSEAIFS